MASLGNVLILVENLSVPLDRRVWQESLSLTEAGYRVFVICPQGNEVDMLPFEQLDGVQIYRYPLRAARGGPLGYAREYAWALAHTRRLVGILGQRRRFAVVHACNPPDLLLLAAMPLRRRGAAFVFDHHDLVPELYLSRFGRGEDFVYAASKFAEKLAMRAADVVISTNESYARIARQRGGCAPDDVFVVRNAPNVAEFRRVAERPELRRGKRHLLAYVGVMGPQDGIDHALHALAELRRTRNDWHAVFVGSGDVLEPMLSLRDYLGLRRDVTFTGRIPVNDLLAVLSTADIGLAPDPKNPLNEVSTMNKIVEYMAVGLPVVCYELAEARVSAGQAAMYASPSDPSVFAQCVNSLLGDGRKRYEMGRIGEARVREQLSWDRSEHNLLRAYQRAIERRGWRGVHTPAVRNAEMVGA